jgi:hypothetical protein
MGVALPRQLCQGGEEDPQTIENWWLASLNLLVLTGDCQ